MRCRHPLLAFVFCPFANDGSGAAAQGAVCADLDRIGVGDHHDGMCGTCPRHPPPIWFGTSISAAINDNPLALVAQFEGQWTGMRVVVKTLWRWSPGVDQHEALESLQPIKAGGRRA